MNDCFVFKNCSPGWSMFSGKLFGAGQNQNRTWFHSLFCQHYRLFFYSPHSKMELNKFVLAALTYKEVLFRRCPNTCFWFFWYRLYFPNNSSWQKAKISDVLAANIFLMGHQSKEQWRWQGNREESVVLTGFLLMEMVYFNCQHTKGKCVQKSHSYGSWRNCHFVRPTFNKSLNFGSSVVRILTT